MIPVTCSQIEVFLFRRRGQKVEFLLIRRAPDRSLAGIWQPVTGGIEKGEAAYHAAAREVFEETGLTPTCWWALEHLTMYYEPARDVVAVVPVFVAEVPWTDPVHLSHEHDRYAFASLAVTATRMHWDSQRLALAAVRTEVLAAGRKTSARELTARIAALGVRRWGHAPRKQSRVTKTTPRPRRRAGA